MQLYPLLGQRAISLNAEGRKEFEIGTPPPPGGGEENGTFN
jgi:hypothetical protein